MICEIDPSQQKTIVYLLYHCRKQHSTFSGKLGYCKWPIKDSTAQRQKGKCVIWKPTLANGEIVLRTHLHEKENKMVASLAVQKCVYIIYASVYKYNGH